MSTPADSALFSLSLTVASVLAAEIDFGEDGAAFAAELHSSLAIEPPRRKGIRAWRKGRQWAIDNAVFLLMGEMRSARRGFTMSEGAENQLIELGLLAADDFGDLHIV
jgi:hypothetical protein